MRPDTDPCLSYLQNCHDPGTHHPTSSNALAATLGLSLGVLLNRAQGLLGMGSVIVSFPTSWLYIRVVAKTVMLPTKNVGVNLKLNNEG